MKVFLYCSVVCSCLCRGLCFVGVLVLFVFGVLSCFCVLVGVCVGVLVCVVLCLCLCRCLSSVFL